jgi:hypothetical protein
MPRQLDIERNYASGFTFPPIDSSKQQIRLIKIVPSSVGSLINCEFVISTADVAQSLPYSALSYTWGAATLDQDIDKIILHGHIFWIRKNLWNFMDYERLQPQQKLFWVDACCINQTESDSASIKEKNHQVTLMRHIYHRAAEVVIWLGKPPQDLEWQLDHLYAFLDSSWSGGDLPEYDICDLRAFGYLWSKPYWRRVWIVQEILMAKRIILRCGNFKFEWHWFVQFYAKIHKEDKTTLNRRPMFGGINVLLRPTSTLPEVYPSYFPRNTSQIWDFTIESIVVEFRNQECLNPLDKIYGFLGLLNDHVIDPDYNKTTVQLYNDIMRFGIIFISNNDVTYPGRAIRIARLRHYLKETLHLSPLEVKDVEGSLEKETKMDFKTLDDISLSLYSEKG